MGAPAKSRFAFDADELARIAREAYLYFYPLVLMEITRRNSTRSGDPLRGDMNQFAHARSFPPGEFRTIVRPNFDTLYSIAWVDLTDEPYVISVPALPPDRFVMLPCYDMWTEVFASPGTRTNGSAAFSFALCRPEWSGALPEGVERINAPTPTVWVLGRTETYGEADYPYIHTFQDALSVSPLSTYPHRAPLTPPPASDPDVDTRTPPMLALQQMTPREFFATAARLVAIHPPHGTDWNMVARLRQLGWRVGEPYDLDAQSDDVRAAFEDVTAGARQSMLSWFSAQAPPVNGWRTHREVMAVWGDHYVKRALVAMTGLGANPPEESLYPNCEVDAHGEKLDGTHRYRLHFDADALPPVRAFWSITVYDPRGYPVANSINRYALGDLAEMRYNDDGSLDLYVQRDEPATEWHDNWLPVPDGPFVLTMRLYLPDEAALDGRWSPPPVEPVD